VAAGAAAFTVLLIVVVFSGVMTFFLLRDGSAGWAVLTSRLADWRRKELDAAGDRAVGALGGYMLGTGALSAFGAVTQWLIMVVLGIPLALPLAILAFFGGFIPYFGSLIVTGLAFLVTVKYGSTQDIVIMAIFTIVINLVQGSILGPIIYGRAVSIHPGVVLLAVPVGSALAGIVGMFLVIPVLGIIATTWRAVLFVIGDGTRDSTMGDLEPSRVPATGPPDP
jgi:predicted PurR-regulated permease PerM